jgi:integrase/recombinase XerD
MRRTFATELAERSVGLEVIQVALGHEVLETTRDYVQVRERRLREAMAVHQELVLAEMGPPGEQGPAAGPAAALQGPFAGRGPDRARGRMPRSKQAIDGALARSMEAFLLDQEGTRSSKTIQGERYALAAILRDATVLGLPADLSLWTERDVLALRRRWDLLAPATVHGYASALGAFLSFHGNDVVLGMRRRRRLPLPPAKRGIVRVTDEATRRLLFAHADPTQRAAMALGFGLGLRAGEMCALRLEDVRDGNVVVRCGKGGRRRAVPITPAFEEELRAFAAGHRARIIEWARLEGRGAQDPGTLLVQICHRAPRPFTPNALSMSLSQLGRRLGVRFSPHDMRRSFATELADREVGLEVIQVALGHVKLGTTRDYVQVKQRRLREALDGYQGAVCAAVGPKAG